MESRRLSRVISVGDKRFILQIRFNKEEAMNISEKSNRVAGGCDDYSSLQPVRRDWRQAQGERRTKRTAHQRRASQRGRSASIRPGNRRVYQGAGDRSQRCRRARQPWLHVSCAAKRCRGRGGFHARRSSWRPKETTAYLGRGQAEIKLKQFEPALADLSKAIELKPDDPNAYRFRGFANIGKSDWNGRHCRLRQGDRDESTGRTSSTCGALSPSEASTSLTTR